MSDESKPNQNGTAKDSTQNGPVIPDRSVKPPFMPSNFLSKDEQNQIHSEVVAVIEKARQEQEKRLQERRLEEERQEKEQKEKELKEKLEREESEKRKMEEEKRQEKKRLERQKAEEREEKENKTWEEKEKRGKEQNSDMPSKSMSLDSPAPNHIVSEIKVSSLFCGSYFTNEW